MKFLRLVAFQLFICYSTQSSNWLNELSPTDGNPLFEDGHDLLATGEDPEMAYLDFSSTCENLLDYDPPLEQFPCAALPSTNTLAPAPALQASSKQASSDTDHLEPHNEPFQLHSEARKWGCIFLDQLKRTVDELSASLDDHQILTLRTIQHEAIRATASGGFATLPLADTKSTDLSEKHIKDHSSAENSSSHAAPVAQTSPLTARHFTVEPHAFHVPPVSPRELKERGIWFPKSCGPYVCSQLSINQKKLPVSFSQRYTYGASTSKRHGACMWNYLMHTSYLIAPNRIMFMDGSIKGVPKWISHTTYTANDLDEENLKVEQFRKLYPLKENGLVVSLCANYKLVMASYGKPPLGATILRPEGEWLVSIARSSDNTVKSHNIQDGDIVVVAPFSAISKLLLGSLKLTAKDSIEKIIEQIHKTATGASLCVVATISAK